MEQTERDHCELAIAAIQDDLSSLIYRKQIEDAAALIYGALAKTRNPEQLTKSITKIASDLPHWIAHRSDHLSSSYMPNTRDRDELVVIRITTAIRTAISKDPAWIGRARMVGRQGMARFVAWWIASALYSLPDIRH